MNNILWYLDNYIIFIINKKYKQILLRETKNVMFKFCFR